ncbi:MAG: transcriptional repressor [Ruminococcus sp.]|nr:transcriptional repressor [Ruminococcus sp.]
MSKYNTAQREELLRFLGAHSSDAFTVSGLIEAMKNDPDFGKPLAESTAYRLIKQLVEEGKVKRTVSGVSREFRYQLAADEECKGHLHLKCSVCGELLHMHHESSERIAESLLEEEDFSLDTGMVLTGICKKCRE